MLPQQILYDPDLHTTKAAHMGSLPYTVFESLDRSTWKFMRGIWARGSGHEKHLHRAVLFALGLHTRGRIVLRLNGPDDIRRSSLVLGNYHQDCRFLFNVISHPTLPQGWAYMTKADGVITLHPHGDLDETIVRYLEYRTGLVLDPQLARHALKRMGRKHLRASKPADALILHYDRFDVAIHPNGKVEKFYTAAHNKRGKVYRTYPHEGAAAVRIGSCLIDEDVAARPYQHSTIGNYFAQRTWGYTPDGFRAHRNDGATGALFHRTLLALLGHDVRNRPIIHVNHDKADNRLINLWLLEPHPFSDHIFAIVNHPGRFCWLDPTTGQYHGPHPIEDVARRAILHHIGLDLPEVMANSAVFYLLDSPRQIEFRRTPQGPELRLLNLKNERILIRSDGSRTVIRPTAT